MADDLTARFPAGARVKVFVMPNHPEVSVLKPGLDRMLWVIAASGLCLVLVGGTLCLAFLRRGRADEDSNGAGRG